MFDIEHLIKADQIVNKGSFSMLDTPDTNTPDSLVYCEDIFHLERAVSNNNVSAIITSSELLRLINANINKGIVISRSPKVTYWELHNKLIKEELLKPEMEFGMGHNCTLHPTSVISKKSLFGDNVVIGANAVVGDYSIIGDNTTIAPGGIIGAEGLQSVLHDDKRVFVKHAGGVRIGKNVTIMANAVVQKAVRPRFTEIGDNCQISILVSIGHGSRIGKNCAFAGNVFIGGGVKIGNDVIVGPSATIKDGLMIESNVQVKLGSVVVKDVGKGEIVSGNFALSHTKNLRDYARKISK